MGRTEGPEPETDYKASLWLDRHMFHENKMALFSECLPKCAQKPFDTADIVREAIFPTVVE
jgi:hypothetical protein